MSVPEPTQGQVEPTPGRPRIAPGYGIEREMTPEMLPWSVVVGWLTVARNYWVVTAHPDGRPHAAPVWGVWLDDGFYFATDRASRKGRNLAANRELVVHLESGDDVTILEGAAEEVTEKESVGRFVDVYNAKYQIEPAQDDPTAVIYALRPRVAYAWRERDFPRSATRWTFEPDR